MGDTTGQTHPRGRTSRTPLLLSQFPLEQPRALFPACCFIMRNKRGNKQEAQPAKFVLKNNNNRRDKGIRNSTRTVGKQRQEEEEEGERVAIYLNLPFNLSRCLDLNFASRARAQLSSPLLQQKSINYLSLKLSATCHYVIVYSLPQERERERETAQGVAQKFPLLFNFINSQLRRSPGLSPSSVLAQH